MNAVIRLFCIIKVIKALSYTSEILAITLTRCSMANLTSLALLLGWAMLSIFQG